MTFYERFKEICKSIGSSPTGVAKRAGISGATVSDWKNKGTTPSAENLAKLSACLEVSVDYLLGKTEIKKPLEQQTPEDIAKVALFGGAGEVTEEMWEEVKSFVEFVKQKHGQDRKNS